MDRFLNENRCIQIHSHLNIGWQILLDNPTCFLSDAVEIAKTEISALQNQP